MSCLIYKLNYIKQIPSIFKKNCNIGHYFVNFSYFSIILNKISPKNTAVQQNTVNRLIILWRERESPFRDLWKKDKADIPLYEKCIQIWKKSRSHVSKLFLYTTVTTKLNNILTNYSGDFYLSWIHRYRRNSVIMRKLAFFLLFCLFYDHRECVRGSEIN